MALAAERVMPIVPAYWHELRKAWVIALPFGPDLEARTEADVTSLVARYAPGSAVQFLRNTAGDVKAPSAP